MTAQRQTAEEHEGFGSVTEIAGILRAAIEKYRSPNGYEGHLLEAAVLLETFGQEAWPVLENLAQSGVAECEYFVAAIVRLRAVEASEKRSALLALARNSDPNTRSRLLELLDELPREFRKEILRVLSSASPTCLPDEVTERAGEALALRVSTLCDYSMGQYGAWART